MAMTKASKSCVNPELSRAQGASDEHQMHAVLRTLYLRYSGVHRYAIIHSKRRGYLWAPLM